MKKMEEMTNWIVLILVSALFFILMYEVAIVAATNVVRLENSRNPIIVFPPNDSTPISKPIYL
jgi:hypothetical protein